MKLKITFDYASKSKKADEYTFRHFPQYLQLLLGDERLASQHTDLRSDVHFA